MTEYLTTLACIAGAIGIVTALFAPLADLIAPLGYEDEDGFHLGIGGGELRDLRNLHSGSDTVS